jgi:hypothetical protein
MTTPVALRMQETACNSKDREIRVDRLFQEFLVSCPSHQDPEDCQSEIKWKY